MTTMPLTGSWITRYRQDPQAPLTPGPDPQHTKPDANPEYQASAPSWVSTAPAPGLPQELLPGVLPTLATGLPLDHTPQAHTYGVGTNPGLSTLGALDNAAPWREDDQGAVAQHGWHPAVQRDGEPHLAVIPDMIGNGDSPETLQLQRTGVGQPNDPEARRAKRMKRWYDRRIDMHRWRSQPPPLSPRYAHTAQPTPTVPSGGPLVSPYPSAVTYRASTQDRFLVGLARRTPGPWDESAITDGSASVAAQAPTGFGLTTYGL